MFDYIKKKVQEQEDLNRSNAEFENDDSELIVEYAHLFQELDDLTVEGEDVNRTRSMGIDIPLEDDVEIDSIEFNISDGRITDVPMDATVQESNYTVMKTFEDFYQEALNVVPRFPRDTNESHGFRCVVEARKNFDKYKSHVIQEGLFGFDKISLDDPRIPSKITVNFGPMAPGKSDYFVKLDVFFEIDKKRRILKKQLESVNFAVSNEAFERLGEALPNLMREAYPNQMADVKNIWDVMTPVKVCVPVDPIDTYKIYVGFECDFLDGIDYFSWSLPIKSATTRHKSDEGFENTFEPMKKNVVDGLDIMSKKEFMKESYEIRRPDRFSSDNNIYQEAIDFGDEGSEPPASDNNTGDDDTPSVSMDENSGGEEATPPAEEKTPVDTNNVSDQIAEKVSEETNSENNSDIPTDDTSMTDPTSTDDMSMDPNVDPTSTDPTSVDQQLNDLDESGNTDMGLDEGPTAEVDVENMTIDELLEQGSEKLKGMTIQQLKDFLATGTEAEIQEMFTQESFILTKKNINKEVDVNLRKVLGILNDNQMELEELIKEFKKAGKKLNRVLSKAGKMKKVYSDDECNEMIKLNKCLVDLMQTMKVSDESSYLSVIKRLMKAFTTQSPVVAKIVESKKSSDNNGKEEKDGE